MTRASRHLVAAGICFLFGGAHFAMAEPFQYYNLTIIARTEYDSDIKQADNAPIILDFFSDQGGTPISDQINAKPANGKWLVRREQGGIPSIDYTKITQICARFAKSKKFPIVETCQPIDPKNIQSDGVYWDPRSYAPAQEYWAARRDRLSAELAVNGFSPEIEQKINNHFDGIPADFIDKHSINLYARMIEAASDAKSALTYNRYYLLGKGSNTPGLMKIENAILEEPAYADIVLNSYLNISLQAQDDASNPNFYKNYISTLVWLANTSPPRSSLMNFRKITSMVRDSTRPGMKEEFLRQMEFFQSDRMSGDTDSDRRYALLSANDLASMVDCKGAAQPSIMDLIHALVQRSPTQDYSNFTELRRCFGT
ncbi:hypothetical protein [Paracoccus aminovorans]|uniref:hypothetical protein n=1 Tax=Paracoccus aminovorans TaxID=34004 RepID=UPI002B25ED8A|nr:hypothetical protein [Paracoccus aminovorans]